MSSTSESAGPPPIRRLFKEIAQGSGVYFVGFIVQRVAGVLMMPITTRFLSPADYGIADLQEQTTSVLSVLLGVRLASALGYFYFRANSAEARRPLVSTTVVGAALLGLLATAICWPFSDPMAHLVFGDVAAGHYFRVTFLIFPVSFAAEALYTVYRVEDRPGAYTVMSTFRLALQIAGIILLVALFRMHVMGVIYASVVSISVVTAVMAVQCYRRVAPTFDVRTFTAMVKYTAPLGLGGIATFFIHVGDRFFLPHYRPLGDLGLYVLAYKIGMLMSFVFGAFQIYWSAQVFKIMRRADADTVFARTVTYVILGTSFTGLALVVLARPVLRLMAAPAFQGAAALVPVIVMAYYARAIGDFFRCLFLVEGKPGPDAVCNWVGAGICLAGYLILIPRFGMWGAAFATLGAFAAIGILSVVWTYRLRPYRVETGRLIKIGVASATALIPYLAIPASSTLALTGAALLSMALFAACLWTLRFATPGEWQVAFHTLAWLRQRVLKVS